MASFRSFRFRGRKLFAHDVSCDINADMSADRTKIHSRDTSHDLVSFSPQDDEFGRRNHDGRRSREMRQEIDRSRLTIPTN